MPVVIVEMWEGRTLDQKRNLVKAITEAMVEHAGAKPDHLHVIIHETPLDSWGRAGVLGIDLRAAEERSTESTASEGGGTASAPEGAAASPTPKVRSVSHALLQLADLERAVTFYTGTLGFTIRRRDALTDGRPLVVLEEGLGLTTFPEDGSALRARTAEASPRPVKTLDHLAFRVEKVEPYMARFKASGIPFEGPASTERYGTSIYVRDPEGHRIELHDR